MNKASFYIRQWENGQFVFSHVDGYKFRWNLHDYGVWHKARGQWIVVDIKSGMSVIQIKNLKDLDNHLTTELANKLNAAYKKPFYKQACNLMSYVELSNNKWSNYDETNG